MCLEKSVVEDWFTWAELEIQRIRNATNSQHDLTITVGQESKRIMSKVSCYKQTNSILLKLLRRSYIKDKI